MSAGYAIGIDLGTTHCALARVPLEGDGRTEIVQVPQLVAGGGLQSRRLLPSFIYLPPEAEGAMALPWDADRSVAVGDMARARGAEVPGRVVASAKSWLCHPSADRRAGMLPLGAAEDVDKVSPVEAAFRYLEHLIEAYDQQYAGSDGPLTDQKVVLTVPASFDAAARDLTVEAALAAGIDDLTLLEEPQAALYAWLEQAGEGWRKQLTVGDVVLVVDDFLASGSCQEAMFRLVARAGARPAGLAVLVEKTFDGGRDFLSAWPVPVASLAAIVSVDNGYIELLEEDEFDDAGILDFGEDADDTVFGLDFLPVGGDP